MKYQWIVNLYLKAFHHEKRQSSNYFNLDTNHDIFDRIMSQDRSIFVEVTMAEVYYHILMSCIAVLFDISFHNWSKAYVKLKEDREISQIRKHLKLGY